MDLLREYVVYKVEDGSRCPTQCAIGSVYQPSLPDDMQFYAIGALIYTLPSIGALADDAVFVPAVGYQKAFEFCQLVGLMSILLLWQRSVMIMMVEVAVKVFCRRCGWIYSITLNCIF